MTQPQLRQTQPHHRRVQPTLINPIFGKQRNRAWRFLPFVQHLYGASPGPCLRIVDLAKVQHMALQHASVGKPSILDNA